MKALSMIAGTGALAAGLFSLGFLARPVPRLAPAVLAIDNPEADVSLL
jgi:hypothetical protein